MRIPILQIGKLRLDPVRNLYTARPNQKPGLPDSEHFGNHLERIPTRLSFGAV